MYRSIVKNTITLIAETRNEIAAVKDVLKPVASGYEYKMVENNDSLYVKILPGLNLPPQERKFEIDRIMSSLEDALKYHRV
jgi:hypothetical protein